jgi:hypothetical protein
MKLTIKILLVICLFCSVALADGEMGSGGKTCPPQTTCLDSDGEMGSGGKSTAIKTEDTASLDGEMGSGGRTVNDQTQNDSVLTFIQNYLISIFG